MKGFVLKIHALIFFSLLCSSSMLFTNAAETYPPLAPAADDSAFGQNIQRTMTLLATSTPEHHNKVRILFYGQSITEQEWSKYVADDLRKRFPNADLDIQNRAIGGFASQILVRIAEHDLYPFYPDLLIFHVYGANQQYEEIIANTRQRTTAEILMQKDHVTKWPPDEIDEKKDKGMWWDNMMNQKFLPGIAKKYGCGLADVRAVWLDYLKTNKLEPKDLLKDGVHLNAHGNFLMSEIINRNLAYKPTLPNDNWKDLVRTVQVGKDVQWKEGKLTLEFEGNRVDAIAAQAAESGQAEIRIDGKKPSDFPELYTIMRTSVSQAGFWPSILRVTHEKPLLLEDWTVTITEVIEGEKSCKFKFDVSGSKTGADGSGSSEAKFVSNSGRVAIESKDWWLNNARQQSQKKVPVGFTAHWHINPMFVDEYKPLKAEDPTHEYPTTLAQGLSNEKHTLEIVQTGTTPVAIKEIRVYTPPVK